MLKIAAIYSFQWPCMIFHYTAYYANIYFTWKWKYIGLFKNHFYQLNQMENNTFD